MTPKNPLDLLSNSPEMDRLVRESKAARRAMKKASRKLKAAKKARGFTEISLLLGMARIAIDKAAFVAKTSFTKGN